MCKCTNTAAYTLHRCTDKQIVLIYEGWSIRIHQLTLTHTRTFSGMFKRIVLSYLSAESQGLEYGQDVDGIPLGHGQLEVVQGVAPGDARSVHELVREEVAAQRVRQPLGVQNDHITEIAFQVDNLEKRGNV